YRKPKSARLLERKGKRESGLTARPRRVRLAIYLTKNGWPRNGNEGSRKLPIIYSSDFSHYTEPNTAAYGFEFAFRSADAAAFALEANADPRDCGGGLLARAVDWAHFADRSGRRSQCRADSQWGRARHWCILASLHFQRDLDLAKPRHRRSQHGEFRRPMDAPRDRTARLRHCARQLNARRRRRAYGISKMRGRRSQRCLHHRRPARTALRRQARPCDFGPADRQAHLRLLHRREARAHISQILGPVPITLSVFAHGDVRRAADSRADGRR